MVMVIVPSPYPGKKAYRLSQGMAPTKPYAYGFKRNNALRRTVHPPRQIIVKQ